MKKVFAMLLALVTLVSLTACGGSAKGGDRLEQIKKQGYLNFCTEPYFAPYEFMDPNLSGDEQYVGVDIEFARRIADKIGVPLKITPLDFTAVLAGVADGKYDLAISAIAYAPTRAEAMRLSNAYEQGTAGFGFLVRSEDAAKYNSIEDLADAIVITQSGSVQESLYNSNVKKSKEFKLVANMTDAYLAVAEKKADVCICEVDSASLYAEANGGKMCTTDYRFYVDPNMNGTVVAMPTKDTESLCQLVNEVIDELNAENQIEQWVTEYKAYAKTLGLD